MIERLRVWWENLNENYKRIILLIGFSILVFFMLYAIYFVFFKSTTTTLPPGTETPGVLPGGGVLPITDIRDILEDRGITPEDAEELIPTILPDAEDLRPDFIAQGGMTLANPKVYYGAQSASLGPNGQIQYYNSDDGKFYQLIDDKIVSLSDKEFPNVEKITWAPKQSQAILEFPDGTNIFYDFEEEKQYTLPREGINFDFNNSGEQIGYQFITDNPDENWLVISNPNGNDTVAIEHIGKANPDDISVNWSPEGSRVATYRESASLESEEVFFVGPNQENYKSLKVQGRGFEGLWSPQGNTLLYNIHSADTGYRPELWITNASEDDMGVNNKSIGLRTWISKCTFGSGGNAYCAVPIYLKQGSGLYPALATNVPDVIYKINTKTGFKQRIAIPTNALGVRLFTAKQLILSDDEKTLHMLDNNGGIYDIQLSE